MMNTLSSKNKGFARIAKRGGFTLIEMLVSISIFVLVAFTITSTLIAVSEANRKAQELKQIMDNLNFSVQGMVLRMREGSDYTCANTNAIPDNPEDGGKECGGDGKGNAIVFYDPTPADSNNPNGVAVKYYLDTFDKPSGETGGIVKVEGINNSNESFNITSEEVDIKLMTFQVGGIGNSTTDRPYVIIEIVGEARLRSGESTSFTLRTFVASHKG